MYEAYRARMERRGNSLSDVLRKQSEAVVNATFLQSVSYRPVMVKHIESGLPTFDEDVDEILDAHFDQKSKYDIKGDEVAYWITFRPHEHKTHTEIAVGSYVSIPNDDGDREIWLIVHCDVDEEHRKYQILQTNHILKWMYDGKIYQSLVCLRNANSYSSGLFTMDRTTTVEDMNTIYAPTNCDICTIGYDQRFIVSDGNRKRPICWQSSKFQTIAPKGITKITLSQVSFDPAHDNAELGIANYYDSALPVVDDSTSTDTGDIAITYSGTKPTIKVGGSAKTFTAGNNLAVTWLVVDGNISHSTSNADYNISIVDNKLQLKVSRNYTLVGKVLTIKAQGANNSVGEVKIEVIS